MKKIVLCLVLVSQFAFADHHEEGEGKGKTFEEKKANALSKIDMRISKMQELKSCISAATDMAATKACREKHKASMKGMMPKRNKNK